MILLLRFVFFYSFTSPTKIGAKVQLKGHCGTTVSFFGTLVSPYPLSPTFVLYITIDDVVKEMKIKRMAILIVTLLSVLMLTTFSSATLAQPGESTSGSKIPPDMPADALQFNRTTITPSGDMEAIQAMETSVFFYRNFTLMMDCTRNCELTMTLDPQVRDRLLSISVEPNQTMTLAMNVSASPPQGEAVMEQSLNFYMGLEPNDDLQLEGQLRLHINQTELSEELGREVNASMLTWMYWNPTQNQWIPVESYMDQNGYLICNTDHFSTWTVAEYDPELIPENIHIFTVVGLVAIVSVASIYLKRKKS